jgi:hypothetical protein
VLWVLVDPIWRQAAITLNAASIKIFRELVPCVPSHIAAMGFEFIANRIPPSETEAYFGMANIDKPFQIAFISSVIACRGMLTHIIPSRQLIEAIFMHLSRCGHVRFHARVIMVNPGYYRLTPTTNFSIAPSPHLPEPSAIGGFAF